MKVGIISTYPPRGKTHAFSSGVGAYTKRLAESLRKKKIKVSIFADIIDKEEEYEENGIRIIRCWRKNFLYPISIFFEIFKRRDEIEIIHIQHEYFLFGNTLNGALFPLLLLYLKLLRKPLIVTLHGVVKPSFLKKISLRKSEGKFLAKGLFLVTKLIDLFSDAIIVHVKFLKEILLREFKLKKNIYVIPHGIEKIKSLKKRNGSKEKRIMFFGYIAPYKGVEILISSSKYLPKNYAILIAGGEHPRLKFDKMYRAYFQKIKKMAERNGKIKFLGFLDEKKIKPLLSSVDIFVFPYKALISSSGTMSLVIGLNKPFLLSKEIEPLIENPMFSFRNKPKDLAKKIKECLSDKKRMNKMIRFISKIRKENEWKKVAELHLRVYREMIE